MASGKLGPGRQPRTSALLLDPDAQDRLRAADGMSPRATCLTSRQCASLSVATITSGHGELPGSLPHRRRDPDRLRARYRPLSRCSAQLRAGTAPHPPTSRKRYPCRVTSCGSRIARRPGRSAAGANSGPVTPPGEPVWKCMCQSRHVIPGQARYPATSWLPCLPALPALTFGSGSAAVGTGLQRRQLVVSEGAASQVGPDDLDVVRRARRRARRGPRHELLLREAQCQHGAS